jgi:hypothetical protein
MRSGLPLVPDLPKACPDGRRRIGRQDGGLLMELSPIFSDRKSGGSEWPLLPDKIQEAHLLCLKKAIDRTHKLLAREAALRDYGQIHSAKSILYAAIEQMGMRGERIFAVQRMLRELLSIVTSQYASPGHDKQVGLQILNELKSRSATL